MWYRNLPQPYAVHFNAAGTPDRWAEGPAEWFLLPLIATVTFLLVLGAGALACRSPQLWNVPEKKKFLALTERQRAPIMDALIRVLDVVAIFSLGVLAFVQWMIYITARAGSGGLPF